MPFYFVSPIQVKRPGPDSNSDWHTVSLPSIPWATKGVGVTNGFSGALGAGKAQIYCGGGYWVDVYSEYYERNKDDLVYTRECYAIELDDSGTPWITRAAPLPRELYWACHGSDGERLVIAGGKNPLTKVAVDEILVL